MPNHGLRFAEDHIYRDAALNPIKLCDKVLLSPAVNLNLDAEGRYGEPWIIGTIVDIYHDGKIGIYLARTKEKVYRMHHSVVKIDEKQYAYNILAASGDTVK